MVVSHMDDGINAGIHHSRDQAGMGSIEPHDIGLVPKIGLEPGWDCGSVELLYALAALKQRCELRPKCVGFDSI